MNKSLKFVNRKQKVLLDFFTRAEDEPSDSRPRKKHNDYISTKVASMFD